jgi:hypothetical protein
MNRFFSQFVDRGYQKLAVAKTCALVLDREELDGVAYDPSSFFQYSKQFFDRPEFFYKRSQYDDYVFDPVVLRKTEHHKLYAFMSPFDSLYRENAKGYFRLFDTAKSDTLLIFSPGWARPNLKLEEKICMKFSEAGIDCLLPTKPYHQERTPKGFYSGELFINANQLFSVSNFRQYVAELRNVVSHYRKQYHKVGIVGMSSGGFQAGLLATVEELDFYFPFMTAAELGSTAWNTSLAKYIKRDLQKKKVTEEQLNQMWAITDQKYLGHNCKAKYVKQYVSKYDNLIPTKYQMKLNEVYKRPKTYYIKSAHISVFFRLNTIVADMIKEVKALP